MKRKVKETVHIPVPAAVVWNWVVEPEMSFHKLKGMLEAA